MEQVKVIIPVYKPILSPRDRASLAQTVKVLGRYPIVLLYSAGLDVSDTLRDFPTLQPMAVSDEWLGRKNGIAGYNRMMLSTEFYDLFADTEYILICHLDAWIFRDELSEWCRAGYDCVAAPWVKRRIYNRPFVRLYMAVSHKLAHALGRLSKLDIYDRVGNGGLSLRRVNAFRRACVKYDQRMEVFRTAKHHLYNEDVFWAIVPDEFRYPDLATALRFAFDTNPRYCYKLSEGRLPFGCHSWSKARMHGFWAPIIGH